MKLNIVGAAPSSAHLAPTDSPSWVCGWHYQEFKHLDVRRIYEIHEVAFKREKYVQSLLDSGIDLVMAKGTPYDGAREFDFERSKRLIGRTYLTSTMAYMISDAISEGYKEIDLYGITLTADSEYFFQRPGMEWWIGFAQGLGIKVRVPKSSPIGKSDKIYGLEFQGGPFGEDSIGELKAQHEQKLAEIKRQQELINTMEIAQTASIDLLDKLSTIAKRHNEGEVIKRLTDSIQVR